MQRVVFVVCVWTPVDVTMNTQSATDMYCTLRVNHVFIVYMKRGVVLGLWRAG